MEHSEDIRYKFLLEEYKQLWTERLQRESSMAQLFLYSLIASVTLLSGVSAFYFNLYTNNPNIVSVLLSYIFLSPAAIIIPIFYVIISYRRDVRIFGSYIQVFFVESGYGPMWEASHDKKADIKPQEALDFVPLTFWALIGVCIGLYWYSLYLCQLACLSAHVISPITLIVIMVLAHKKYSRSKHEYSRKFIPIWRQIYRELHTSSESQHRPNKKLKPDTES